MVQKPAGAVVSLSRLLVGRGREQDRPIQGLAVPPQQQHHHQLYDHHILHVQRPPAPHVAIVKLATEGGMHPLVRLYGDDVGMSKQQQRRVASPLEAGRHIATPGS